jgi:rhodanese-related sulfurtransferase
MQAGVALRVLAGVDAPWGRVTHVDGAAWTTHAFALEQRPDCPACRGEHVRASETLTPAQAQALARSGAVVLDVREAPERAAARPALADRHVPLDRLDAEAFAGQTVLVYCARGARSERAAERLLQAGCARVATLGGGVDAWRAAGLPMAELL